MARAAEGIDRLAGIFGVLSDLSEADQQLLLGELDTADPALADQLRRLLKRDRTLLVQDEPSAWPLTMAALDDLAPHSVRPGERFGDYVIEAEIGRGGMGAVYRASHVDTPATKVAIKFLRRDLGGPLLSDRFAAETRILASLSHPGIARFIEAGNAGDGTAFLVMEHVDGIPIDRWCAQMAPDFAARIRLFRQVLTAIAYAHRHLVVHRDLKPGNILVTAEGRPVLLDFGIARHLTDGLPGESTRTAQRFLTPHFAAPEQLAGGMIGVGCDVYSAGCLLYRLLSGCEPFELDGKSAAEVERVILSVPPPPMVNRAGCRPPDGMSLTPLPASLLRGDVERVVQRCLRKSAHERYPGIEELDSDLAAILAGRPIRERHSERWYRMRKFVSRHRLPVVAASVMLVALAAYVFALMRHNEHLLVERNRALAAIGVLKDAFSSVNPMSLPDNAVGTHQILDAARRSLDEHRGDPLLYAEAASTLADIELATGRYSAAFGLAGKALDAARQAGYPDTRMADLRLLQMRAAIGNGDYELARSLADAEAAHHRRDIRWRLAEGRLASHLGDGDRATTLLESVVRDTPQFESHDNVAVDARLQLAQALRISGRRDEALALLDQTLQWQTDRLAADHPSVLMSRMHRLDLLRRERGPDAAIVEGQALAGDIHRVFGPATAMAATVHTSLGAALRVAGRNDEAIVEFRLAVDAWQQSVGESHVNALRVKFNLAQALATIGQHDEAWMLFEEVIERGRLTLGMNHHSVLFWIHAYAQAAIASGSSARLLDLLTRYLPEIDLAELNADGRQAFFDLMATAREQEGCTRGRSSAPCQESAALFARLLPAGMAD